MSQKAPSPEAEKLVARLIAIYEREHEKMPFEEAANLLAEADEIQEQLGIDPDEID